MNKSREKKDILALQVRLFNLAKERWNISFIKCADIFDSNSIDSYIETAYEFFHIQSDEVNLNEITEMLKKRGVSV